jgi:two-component system phosphate regulon sensor histidine kinase PhoR
LRRKKAILKRLSLLVEEEDRNIEDIILYKKIRDKIKSCEIKYEESNFILKRIYSFLNMLDEGVIITDKNTCIEYHNKKIFEISSKKTLKGRKVSEVIDNYYIDDLLEEVIKTNKSKESEISIYYPNKKIFHCEISSLNLSENLQKYTIYLKDITHEKDNEFYRRNFISNVSHELKTPLTSIHGYAETLINSDLEDKDVIKSFLGIIENESARMSRLINDLLDLEKLENGEGNFNEDIQIDEVVSYVEKILGPLAEELNVQMTEEGINGIEIKSDFDRMVQLLIILVDNAIKYTSLKENGEKTIKIIKSYEENKALIKVEDTGIGIPDKSKKLIFERFYRVDKARSRKMGGTGLGLAIAKNIVQIMNGEITFHSEYGKGTTFEIKIPLKR